MPSPSTPQPSPSDPRSDQQRAYDRALGDIIKAFDHIHGIPVDGFVANLTNFVEWGRTIKPDLNLRSLPQDLTHLSNIDTAIVLNFVSAEVLLPLGELRVVNIDRNRFCLYRANVDHSSVERIPYLGREIKILNLFQRAPNGIHFAKVVGDYALIDHTGIVADNIEMLKSMRSMSNEGFPLAKDFIQALKESGITDQEYADILGVKRSRLEAIQRVKDIIFGTIDNPNSLPILIGERAQHLIKPKSPLHSLFANTPREAGNPEFEYFGACVCEMSATLGGIIDEVDTHLNSGNYKLARIALIDFLICQELRCRDNIGMTLNEIPMWSGHLIRLALKTQDPDLSGSYQLAKRLMRPRNQNVTLERTVEILRDAYKLNFYSDTERIQSLQDSDLHT